MTEMATQPQIRKLQPLEEFNAEIVQKPLAGLLFNVEREIEKRLKEATRRQDKETERRLSLLFMMLRFTINSYKAVCFLLTGDSPKRNDRFALVIAPINRQILDLLFTLIYMMDDFDARSLEYELGGYRFIREFYDKFQGRFGADTKWQQWFDDQRATRKIMETYLPITQAQQTNPASIAYWRAPFKLKLRPSKSQDFLKFLDTWIYGEISAQAHLNAGGLFQVGALLISDLAPDDMRKVIEERNIRQCVFQHFTRTLLTVLAIATEIDTFCRLDNHDALTKLWVILSGYVEEAKDVYELRYQAMLAGPTGS
jgi:hypothetical protein